MSHSTHEGFRLTPFVGWISEPPAAAVSLAMPASNFSSFRDPPRLVCPPVALATDGVGQILEPTSPASVFPCPFPRLGAFRVVRFSFGELRGVGQRSRFAIVSRLASTGPTRPADPP